LAAACAVTALICLILPTSARSGAAYALRSTLVAPLASMQVSAELSRRAFLAHDAALKIVDSVSLRSQRLTGVEEENERLRKLLGLGAALKWGFIPAEALQGRGLGDDFTVTLSAGKSAARYFLELHSVPLRSPLKAGVLIVSSGLGGVYPRGIPIGTIISEMKTAEGFAKSYLMRPVVSLPDISSVFILTRERVRAGVDNVWNNGVYADSLRKAMVAAGDSLHLRRDTVVKAPAKRDSAAKVPLKRDSIVKAPAKRDTTVKPPRKSP
jgi:hypothetical protein